MMLFCDVFLPCVVGNTDWKLNRGSKKMSEYVTSSDEAYALLELENIWEVWSERDAGEWNKSIANRRKQTDDISVAIGDNDDRENATNERPTKLPKLTGKYTGNKEKTRKHKGWSTEGMIRYREIQIMVQEDRKTNKDFDEHYLEKNTMKYKRKEVDTGLGSDPMGALDIDRENMEEWAV
jgi:hypothetical protein